MLLSERAAAPIFRGLAQEHYLRGLEPAAFSERAAHYLAELNALHPFRDGQWTSDTGPLLARWHTTVAITPLSWKQMTQADMLEASRRSYSGDLGPADDADSAPSASRRSPPGATISAGVTFHEGRATTHTTE